MTPQKKNAILQSMLLGGDVSRYPIQLLVNYWEFCPTLGGSATSSRKSSILSDRLDQLLRQGVKHVASFVPWQAVESDISHMLTRFLHGLSERGMSVCLILTPEPGVHYPHSGFPRDVVTRKEEIALAPNPSVSESEARPHGVFLPPSAFSIPSFYGPEFNKRYSGFLARLDGYFADLSKTQPQLTDKVTLVFSGSYWKYFRLPSLSAAEAFGGVAGDYSGSAALSFRSRLEQFYSQREFLDPHPLSANRWKSRQLDDVNRHWFFQDSENQFRLRTFQLARRRSAALSAWEMELFTPEADPAFCFSHLLQTVSGGYADVSRLSRLLDEISSRLTFGAEGACSPFVHWSSIGGFRTLADPEKQFLILKSLLFMGAQGGGVLLDESDWFALSHAFRSRADAIARLIAHGDVRQKVQAFYLAPHVWSSAGPLWNELRRNGGNGTKLTASMELILKNRDARLVVVDPSVILTREAVFKMVALAKGGKIIVLPRSALYTEAAKRELEASVASQKRIQVDLGVPYHIYTLGGEGKLILYELPDHALPAKESLSAWQRFSTAILALAEIEGYCRISDSRLSLIALEKAGGLKQGEETELGLFVLNGTRREVSADLIFPNAVAVSDFAGLFSASTQVGGKENGRVIASRVTLEAAPCGILSLAVERSREVIVQGGLEEGRRPDGIDL